MALLQRKPESLAPEAGEPAADRAPNEIAAGVAQPLRGELEALLGPDRLLAGAGDLVRYASDASPYRFFPKAVVMAREAGDVAKVLAYGREKGIPVTFRAGGTSLNGQGQSDGILVDVRRHFAGVAVEDDGEIARIKPGTVLGHANRVLAPHGRKLGPDPASTDIATVGGVVANNSGGMRCGVTRDSYSTVRAMTFVLPSGTTIDTAAPDAAERFAEAEPELAAGLAEIRDEIRADEELSVRIRAKFAIKNTTGYRLCAFLDAEEPLEIFRRLVVGSEGTLAFLAEVVFETVPLPVTTTTAWIHFPDVDQAIAPVRDFVEAGASAVELMVAPALITAAWNMVGAPEEWKELPPESAVLLVEFGAATEAELDDYIAKAGEIAASHETIRPIEFSRDPEGIELSWRVREGLHGLIGKLRLPGTALIVEDVCVPPERIAEGARDLQALLGEHGFLAGVAGHASAGNLHFMLTPDFAKQEDLDRYEAFMTGLVELIVDKYDGSLKAEHGTGINMAPYVEREWGAKATELMWRVKKLADPDGVLSPGVVLNRDPGAHLRNLKTTPAIEESATACVECGFCEPVCPSRNLTTTPRQRIVLRREMARQPSGSPVQRALLKEFEYEGLETCAADGSCQLACPVGIDTGQLVKELRRERHTERAEKAALATARRWDTVEGASRVGLRFGGPLARQTKKGRSLPPPAPGKLPPTLHEGAAAVYVPSCTNRIFGTLADGPKTGDIGPKSAHRPWVVEALVEVSARAGMPVWIPEDVAGSCCGLPWSSKGFGDAHRHKANEMVARLWAWSGEGALPIVIDAASCTHSVADPGPGVLDEANAERLAKLEILDSVAWAHDRLLPWLEVAEKVGSATVHPTCATRHMGLAPRLESIAGALAEDVFVAPSSTCCGFAGDRGISHPELTESATRPQAEELSGRSFDAHLSSNRTCEIGLERATGEPYESVLILLERLTRSHPQ
ncbi:MAG TPA: FAD-binding and (Fe-S)-binding domain-containing protein [Solirubrobacterales bacterium]|jgi:D-lactate dehydrogenase|nr:FAD-binding and (Fe-S)-binding domain-containing protein [Solirubrobacterales bacterium]